MAERLLCERDVLNKLSWPSRKYVDARIRNDHFPEPYKTVLGLGDQWRESDIDRWLGVPEKARAGGEDSLLERFA